MGQKYEEGGMSVYTDSPRIHRAVVVQRAAFWKLLVVE